jgi:hypothetical protein
MKSNAPSDPATPDGDDRLIDALFREHARAGTTADQAFLSRLDSSLNAEEPDSDRLVTMPVAKHRTPKFAWAIGLAASVLIAAGLIWTYPFNGQSTDTSVVGHSPQERDLLETTLPSELIEGTPKPMSVPRLEPIPTQVPEFYVPRGTVLLSAGKPVTSSDDDPIIGSLDMITDGEKDAGEGYFVELMEGLQWVQIDLEKSAAIHAIWIWHFHSQRRAYHDVIVQISDDPDFKAGVTTLFNNDYDGSANFGLGRDNPYVDTRFGKIVDGKGTKGRYVRLYSNGSTSTEMNHYIEVEVFGIGR